MPLKLINTPRIDWFVVGDRLQVSNLLNTCTAIGQKRSHGKGQVYQWEIKEIQEDWSRLRNGKLTRPLPIELIDNPIQYNILRWGWKNPSWLPESISLCAMPNNQSC